MAARLGAPGTGSRRHPDAVRSQIARLVAAGEASHRLDLSRLTGLSRSSIHTHVQDLVDAGLLQGEDAGGGGRGRPALRLSLAGDAGVVLIADLAPFSTRCVVTDLTQRVLADVAFPWQLSEGPEPTVALLVDRFADLLGQAKIPADRPRVLVVGLPGPVDVARGMAVRPPIMPGWDGFPVAERLGGVLGCPVLVDNDVNLMALGEARTVPPEQLPVLFVTVGAGIGAGFVLADGTLHRGADGAAGDIGHIRVPGAEEVVCRCGKAGCVEAVASTAALARGLTPTGEPPLDLAEDGAAMRDFVARLRDGLPEALHAVRAAGATLGEVIALCIHMLNPRHVVVGGEVVEASDDLLSAVRAVVYRHALPLATRELAITRSELGGDAAVVGAMVLGIEQLLSPTGIGRFLGPRGTP
ncbi:ROK family transcriptional regulator [Streptomyces sp. NBC_00243]|uniref:ROK family transcriptional regulator n=1 Tax=Streptomyces sp. NBC_00243 TaxID=2975688 RepID=UPI002DD97717|nr:ROK family transcriptional regulator [Streptomyces sp. NBC_00243]WRZ18283.1 ROK family transcriptional regulator [Streptomyces sp. NBC_00243]